jgi:subtilisin family serine protease
MGHGTRRWAIAQPKFGTNETMGHRREKIMRRMKRFFWVTLAALLAIPLLFGLDGGGHAQGPSSQTGGNIYSRLDPLLQMLVDSGKPPTRKNQPLRSEDLWSPKLVQTAWALRSVIRLDGTLTRGAPITVPAILHLQRGASLTNVKALGVQVMARIGDVAAVRIPVQAVEQVAALPQVVYVEASKWLFPQLETSAEITRARWVHPFNDGGTPGDPKDDSFAGLTGKGVVVAIIDTGIDTNHPAFRQTNGEEKETRILPSSIQKDITKGCAAGHGTHVASIAAGNGLPLSMKLISKFPFYTYERRYIGIAPEAWIVVKSMDEFPAFKVDNFTHVTHNALDASTALTKLVEIENEVGNRPIVVNMSFGTTWGPHDGSAGLERAIDTFVTEKSGRAVVVSAGNSGNDNGHAELKIGAGEFHNIEINVNVKEPSPALDIWYNADAKLILTIFDPTNPNNSKSFKEGENGEFRFGENQGEVIWGVNSNLSLGSDELVIVWKNVTKST